MVEFMCRHFTIFSAHFSLLCFFLFRLKKVQLYLQYFQRWHARSETQFYKSSYSNVSYLDPDFFDVSILRPFHELAWSEENEYWVLWFLDSNAIESLERVSNSKERGRWPSLLKIIRAYKLLFVQFFRNLLFPPLIAIFIFSTYIIKTMRETTSLTIKPVWNRNFSTAVKLEWNKVTSELRERLLFGSSSGKLC